MSYPTKENGAQHVDEQDAQNSGVMDADTISNRRSKEENRLRLKHDLSIVILLSGCFFFAYLVCLVSTFTVLCLCFARIVVISEVQE